MRPSAPTSKAKLIANVSILDALWAVGAPFIAIALRDPSLLGFGDSGNYADETGLYLAFSVISALAAVLLFRLGEGVTGIVSVRDLRAICSAAVAATAFSAALTFSVTRLGHVPRSTPLICFLVLAGGWTAIRGLGYYLRSSQSLRREDPSQYHPKRVLLVGLDHFASIAIRLTECQRPKSVQFVAALDERQKLIGRTVHGVPIVGQPSDIRSVVAEYAVHGVEIDEVWTSGELTGEASDSQDVVTETCLALGLKHISIVDALNLRPNVSIPTSLESSNPAHHKEVYHVSKYMRTKRSIDIVCALTLCVLISPIALIVASIVASDVGWPLVFWQERVGYKGRKFLLYKFRTLKAPYGRNGAPMQDDQRLSWIGNMLRKSRLDEIPQLVNVLLGDMSLIGPRPLLPVDQPADPSLRLLARPGLSGWAQVNGGNLITTAEKDALDTWYISHACLLLDIKIVIKTVLYFFRGERREHSAIVDAIMWQKGAFE